MPELLPLVDVGYVHLNAGHVHRLEGVQDGVGVVGIRPGVQHDGVVHAVGGVDGVENGPLVVGLDETDLDALGIAGGADEGQQGLIILAAVDGRLPQPQQIQIGAVDDQKLHSSASLMVCTVTSSAPSLDTVTSAKRRYSGSRRAQSWARSVVWEMGRPSVGSLARSRVRRKMVPF